MFNKIPFQRDILKSTFLGKDAQGSARKPVADEPESIGSVPRRDTPRVGMLIAVVAKSTVGVDPAQRGRAGGRYEANDEANDAVAVSSLRQPCGRNEMRRNRLESRIQRPRRARRAWLAVLCLSLALSIASPAAADRYDDSNAGHPVKMIAYLLYPVGVLIDYVVLRPAHWLVSHEPLKTIFGHED